MSVYVIIHGRVEGEGERSWLWCEETDPEAVFYLRNKIPRASISLPMPTPGQQLFLLQHSTWLFLPGATESAKDSSLSK